MTTLRHPTSGHVIQATGRLEARLLEDGWTESDQPAAPGVRFVTGHELDLLSTVVQNAVAASQTDRSDLRDMVEPMALQLPEVAAEVDQLTATVEATNTAQAPKPTPRTDALEAWRTEAAAQIGDILATVQAIDVGAAVDAYLTANPPPAGPPGDDGAPGMDGKSAYQLARDAGYGGTQTQWLASLKGETGTQGPKGDAGIQGPKGDVGQQGPAGGTGPAGPPGTTDYTQLANKPTIPVTRSAIVNTGALTANTVKNVTVTWPTAMPSATYAISALSVSSTPQNIAIGIVSQTAAGCVLAVRSTAAVSATPGLNVHVTATA